VPRETELVVAVQRASNLPSRLLPGAATGAASSSARKTSLGVAGWVAAGGMVVAWCMVHVVHGEWMVLLCCKQPQQGCCCCGGGGGAVMLSASSMAHRAVPPCP
jgi:hypothetical protein